MCELSNQFILFYIIILQYAGYVCIIIIHTWTSMGHGAVYMRCVRSLWKMRVSLAYGSPVVKGIARSVSAHP